MSVNSSEDQRAQRAGLSAFLGGSLPASLIPLATSFGVQHTWTQPNAARPALHSRAAALTEYGRQLLTSAHRRGITVLIPGDPGWPDHSSARDLPCLWLSDTVDLEGLGCRAVTITGSAACTPYGQSVATEFARAMVDAGRIVVTATAFGIARHVVNAVSACGGQMVAVSARGPAPEDQPIQLCEHRADVPNLGAIVSAVPPAEHASRARFAIQQRLLATLAPVVVIVEAGARSSSLAVARHASQSGRLTFAVPGPISSPASAGCHQLVAEGTAQLVTASGQVLSALAHR